MAENEKKNSLVELTKGFIALLATSGGGEIDLSDAEKTLQTQKRRLYDVANVLAGVGLVEKCGKSKVKWTGTMDGLAPMTNDVSLTEREQSIDEMIQAVDKEIQDLSSSEFFQNYAWVSYNDILNIVDQPGLTLFALKGPSSMTISIDEPDETQQQFKLQCRAPDGEIDLIQIGKTGRKQ